MWLSYSDKSARIEGLHFALAAGSMGGYGF